MKMKVAIEPQWDHTQVIACCVQVFGCLAAAPVAPRRWDQHRQLDSEPCQFLRLALVRPYDQCLAHHRHTHEFIIVGWITRERTEPHPGLRCIVYEHTVWSDSRE